MPLDFQILQTGFKFGVQEGVDPHQVPFGVLTRAENVRWTKSGKLEKRNGVTPIATSFTDTLACDSITRLVGGDTLGMVATDETGRRVYAEYLPSRNAWKKLNDASPYLASWSTSVDDITGAGGWDSCVTSNGYEILVYTQGDPRVVASSLADFARYVVREAGSGRVVVPPTLLPSGAVNNNGRIVKVVPNGTSAYVVLSGGSSANLNVWTFDATTLTMSAGTTLRTDTADRGMDACLVNGALFVCYARNTGANRLAFHAFTPGTWVQVYGTTSAEAATTFRDIAVAHGGSDDVLVLYYAGSSELLRYTTVSPGAGATVVAPTTVETGGAGTAQGQQLGVTWVSAGRYLLTYSWQSSAGTTGVWRATSRVFTGGALSTTIVYGTSNAQWATKPVAFDGRFVAWLHTNTNSGAQTVNDPYSTFAVEIPTTAARPGSTDYVPHKRLASGEAIISGPAGVRSVPRPYVFNATPYAGGDVLYAPVSFVSSAPNRLYYRLGIRRMLLEKSPADLGCSAQFGGLRLILAGSLCSSDGCSLYPYGFSSPPSVRSITSAGGTMAVGTYLFSPVAEWRDANGVLFRSPTSLPATLTLAALGSATMAWSTVAVDAHQSDVTITGSDIRPVLLVNYRTVANGSTFHRVTTEPQVMAATTSDPLAATVSVTDNYPDASIDGAGLQLSSRPAIYTTGGILDDYAPPGVQTFAVAKRRIWAVDGSRRTVWFSKSIDDDAGVAPGFHPDLRVNVDTDITALAAMDDKLVLFSRDGISYLLGDGPAPNGQGSDLTSPLPIQSDVGCTNPRSVVSMPDGVLFQSATGIYLLTRGLEVVWIGRAVRDDVDAYPVITSAVLVPRKGEVRFTANTSDGVTGIVLVWNYLEKQWSTSSYLGGSPIVDACVYADTWCFATATGQAYQESETTWLDDGAYVPMVLETAWVSASGPLAFHSVRGVHLGGTSYSHHDLTVDVAFDSDSAYSQSVTFRAGSAVTNIGDLEEADVTIGTRRKCNTIRFRVRDATPTNPGAYPVGTGRGPSFDQIGIEFGVKKGFGTTPAAKRG